MCTFIEICQDCGCKGHIRKQLLQKCNSERKVASYYYKGFDISCMNDIKDICTLLFGRDQNIQYSITNLL